MRILLVFLLITVIVALKITANPAYYLTPDSHYYLQAAQNLSDGRGYRIDFLGQDTFCSIWPVGYSLLIAGISFFTTLSVTLSSKVVNLLAVAGILWLIHRQYKSQSWFVALALLSSSFLQLYANTWSETVFVFFVLVFIFNDMSGEVVSSESNKNKFIIHHLSLIAIFLTRYIGFFLIIPLFIQRKHKTIALFIAVIGLYLLNNYAETHTFTGNHGHWPTEPFLERLIRGLKGIGEEIAFWGIRDWDLKGGSQTMKVFIYGVAIAQVGILVVVGSLLIQSRKSWVSYKYHTSHRYGEPFLYFISLSYLATTIVLYLIDDSIESLYFRRLAPATILALIGCLGWLVEPSQKALFDRIKCWIVAFFVLSVIHALPKMYIFESCMSNYF